MSFKATVSAGWTYTTGDTATASNLNALSIPNVTIPDDQTYLVNVGSVSTPGIAFNGDANTGLAQLSGADTISIIAGGASPVVFSVDQSAFSNGTAAKPTITFFGDADTGVNHDTANEVDIVCGGSVIGLWSGSGLVVTGAIDADAITVDGASVLTAGINTNEYTFYSDCGGLLAAFPMTQTTSATGKLEACIGQTANLNHSGWVSLEVSAVADRASVSVNCIPFVGGRARVRLRFGTNAAPAGILSTPSERFYVIAGFVGSVSETVPTGVAYRGPRFTYLDSESAQWQTVSGNSTTAEVQTTDVTVAIGTTYTLEMLRTATDTYEFYIDGVLKTTHTLLSTTGQGDGLFAVIVAKTVGATARGVRIDSIEIFNPLVRT